MNARFFRRVSDNAWLGRVDTESPLSPAEGQLHCAAEYGFPVVAVDELNITQAVFDTLRAQRMMNAIRPPVQPPPPLTPEQQAWAAAPIAGKLSMIAKRLGLEQ